MNRRAVLFIAGLVAGIPLAMTLRQHEAPGGLARPEMSRRQELTEDGSSRDRPTNLVQTDCSRETFEISSIRARIREHEQRLASNALGPPDLRCTPVQWPEDIAEKYEEVGVRDALATHLRDFDFELDCGEFPCLAVIHGADARIADLRPVKREGFEGARFVEHLFAAHGQKHVFFAPFPDTADEQELQERLQGRIDAQIREIMHEVRDTADHDGKHSEPLGSASSTTPEM